MGAAITRDMTISEIVEKHPETVLVFLAHGLMCLGCEGARSESLEEGAASHEMDLAPLLEDLNAAVEEQGGGAPRS